MFFTIQISTSLSDEFKKRAKKNFPNETFAYLLGHKNDDKILIDELYFPTNVDQFCDPNHVHIQNSWLIEAKKRANQKKIVIIGDIHSHAYNKKQVKIYNADTSPSEQDWNNLKADHIMAICLVTECKNGNLRARTKFWGPMPQVKIKETK